MTPGEKDILERYRAAERLDDAALERMSEVLFDKLARGQAPLPGLDASPIALPELSLAMKLLAGSATKLWLILIGLSVGAAAGVTLWRAGPAAHSTERSHPQLTAASPEPGRAIQLEALDGERPHATITPTLEPLRTRSQREQVGVASSRGKRQYVRAARAANAKPYGATRSGKAAPTDPMPESIAQASIETGATHAHDEAAPMDPATAADDAAKPGATVAAKSDASLEAKPGASVEAKSNLASAVVKPEAATNAHAQGSAHSTDVDAELGLLRRAYTELNAGRPARAFELLDEHEARFPHGVLEQAREVARMLTLCRMGREAAAHVRAQSFVARFPDSAFIGRVRRICPLPTKMPLRSLNP